LLHLTKLLKIFLLNHQQILTLYYVPNSNFTFPPVGLASTSPPLKLLTYTTKRLRFAYNHRLSMTKNSCYGSRFPFDINEVRLRCLHQSL